MKTTLLLVVLTVAAGTALGDADTDASRTAAEEALRKKLFSSYHKEVLPGTLTNITIGKMDINYLQMYEEKHKMDVHCWMSITWTDPRLTWDVTKYTNITTLYITADSVWKPDLTIYSGGDPDRQLILSDSSEQYLLLLYPEGKILFVPSLLLHFTCLMDLTYWPHDKHNCSLKIGSWVHSGFQLSLNIDFEPKISMTKKNIWSGHEISETEWEIESSTVIKESKIYDCCPEPYENIMLSLYLRRNAPAFNWLVKTPVVCVTLVSVVVFLLPTTQTGVKVTLGGLLMLFDLLFLTFASDTVAHSPSHTPLLVKLVAVELVVVSVSVIVSGLVARLAHSPNPDPLPTLLRPPIICLAHLLCLQTYARQASGLGVALKPDEVELGNDTSGMAGDMGSVEVKKGRTTSQWFLLAAVVDRLGLFTYLVLTIIILISFSSVL